LFCHVDSWWQLLAFSTKTKSAFDVAFNNRCAAVKRCLFTFEMLHQNRITFHNLVIYKRSPKFICRVCHFGLKNIFTFFLKSFHMLVLRCIFSTFLTPIHSILFWMIRLAMKYNKNDKSCLCSSRWTFKEMQWLKHLSEN
jgi:hypothetical protein